MAVWLFLLAGLVPRGAHLAPSSDGVGERGRPPRGRVPAAAHRRARRGEQAPLVTACGAQETPPGSVKAKQRTKVCHLQSQTTCGETVTQILNQGST